MQPATDALLAALRALGQQSLLPEDLSSSEGASEEVSVLEAYARLLQLTLASFSSSLEADLEALVEQPVRKARRTPVDGPPCAALGFVASPRPP